MSNKGCVVIGKVSDYPPKGYTSVKVDRQTVFGNPFPITEFTTRESSCNQYSKWFSDRVTEVGSPVNLEFMKLLNRLKSGENICLECWCTPKRCHAETIKNWLEANL